MLSVPKAMSVSSMSPSPSSLSLSAHSLASNLSTPSVLSSAGLKGFRGPILHFFGDPTATSTPEQSYEYLEDGLLVVASDGTVVDCKAAAEVIEEYGSDMEVVDCAGKLIMPGFVDCHIHYPQVDVVGCYGDQLLEWLQNYVFPSEAKFGDLDHAEQVAQVFLNEMLKAGTTTALTFCTVHPESVDALFKAAQQRNMLMIAGKVLMDHPEFTPETLREDAKQSYLDSKALIEKWHGNGRCLYAVTPRFALTSTPEELELAGQLVAEYEDQGVYVHTHMNENPVEIELVKKMHSCDTYLGIYDKFGLTGPRSVFAHCVHMQDSEWDRMSETKSVMAFCPSSNMFLGSGLADLQTVQDRGIRCGLGSDIGAGTSFCHLQTLNDAYKVGQLRGFKLSPLKQFHLATLASAEALSLDDRIGNFLPGKMADFVVLDPAATPLMARRSASSSSLEEKLFLLTTLGADMCVAATYVAGILQYQRGPVQKGYNSDFLCGVCVDAGPKLV